MNDRSDTFAAIGYVLTGLVVITYLVANMMLAFDTNIRVGQITEMLEAIHDEQTD